MLTKIVSFANGAVRNPLTLYALAYGGAASARKGAGFLLFLWLAHSLPVHDYAQFGLLFALQTAITGFASAGILESVIGLFDFESHASEKMRLFSAANAVLFVLMALSTTAVAMIYIYITEPAQRSLSTFFLAAVGGILTAFYALQSSLVRLDEKHLASLLLGFFAPSLGLIGGAIGFWKYGTVLAFFGGSVLGLTVCLPVLYSLRVGTYGIAKSRAEVRVFAEQIGPYILIAMLGWLGGYGNTYLVQYFFSATEVAQFTFIYTLASIIELVATSLNQVWSPRFFILLKQLPLAEMEKKNHRFFLLEGLVLGVVAAMIIMVAPPILRHFGGHLSAYAGLQKELAILFAGYAVSIPWWHAQNYYYAHQQGKRLMFMIILGSIGGIAFWFLAVWVFGTLGIYIGFLMQMVMRMGCAMIWAHRQWRIDFAWGGVVVAFLLIGLGLGARAFLNNALP